MIKPPTSPEEYFSQWQKYVSNGDFMRAEAHYNHPVRLTYTKLIAENSKTVLDVGCGICVDYLRFKNAGVTYSGIDVTPAYLELAQKINAVPKENLFLGNCLSLPFENESFDSVYENGMLEHLPPETWKKAVSEMLRVSKKQILLIFFIPLTENTTKYEPQAAWTIFWGHRYGKTELKSYLSTLGATTEISPPINQSQPNLWYPAETIVVATKK